MTASVTKFDPTSRIKDGKDGLADTSASKSHVKITGDELADGMAVNVYSPAGSNTLVWTGTTYATKAKKHCRAKLNNVTTAASAQGLLGGAAIQVMLTVGDSGKTDFTVLTPAAHRQLFRGVQRDRQHQLQMACPQRLARRQSDRTQ